MPELGFIVRDSRAIILRITLVKSKNLNSIEVVSRLYRNIAIRKID